MKIKCNRNVKIKCYQTIKLGVLLKLLYNKKNVYKLCQYVDTYLDIVLNFNKLVDLKTKRMNGHFAIFTT